MTLNTNGRRKYYGLKYGQNLLYGGNYYGSAYLLRRLIILATYVTRLLSAPHSGIDERLNDFTLRNLRIIARRLPTTLKVVALWLVDYSVRKVRQTQLVSEVSTKRAYKTVKTSTLRLTMYEKVLPSNENSSVDELPYLNFRYLVGSESRNIAIIVVPYTRVSTSRVYRNDDKFGFALFSGAARTVARRECSTELIVSSILRTMKYTAQGFVTRFSRDYKSVLQLALIIAAPRGAYRAATRMLMLGVNWGTNVARQSDLSHQSRSITSGYARIGELKEVMLNSVASSDVPATCTYVRTLVWRQLRVNVALGEEYLINEYRRTVSDLLTLSQSKRSNHGSTTGVYKSRALVSSKSNSKLGNDCSNDIVNVNVAYGSNRSIGYLGRL